MPPLPYLNYTIILIKNNPFQWTKKWYYLHTVYRIACYWEVATRKADLITRLASIIAASGRPDKKLSVPYLFRGRGCSSISHCYELFGTLTDSLV